MTAGKLMLLATSLMAFTLTAGCDDDNNGITDPADQSALLRDSVRFSQTRVFNQVERLGNPLVAEVLLEFKDHGFHDAGTPATDRANFSGRVIRFITTVAGRSQATATAIANTLLPDMITVQTDKAANTAGYLGFVFNPNAYGGRRLQDDVVDISAGAVFGTLLDPNNASPGLATDNVPAFGGGPVPGSAFPYLAAPNVP